MGGDEPILMVLALLIVVAPWILRSGDGGHLDTLGLHWGFGGDVGLGRGVGGVGGHLLLLEHRLPVVILLGSPPFQQTLHRFQRNPLIRILM